MSDNQAKVPAGSKPENNCGFIAFLLTLFVSVVLVIVSSLASSGYSPMYIVTPSSCNKTMFSDMPDWYLEPWRLDLKNGFCPSGAITKDYYRRLSEQEGDRKLFQYKFSDRDGKDRKTLIYNYCLKWHRAPEWSQLDATNQAMGFSSNLDNDQFYWYYSWQLGLSATIISWFVFGAMVFSIKNCGISGPLGLSLVVLPPFAFATWLACGARFSDTDQTDPQSYAKSIFSSCTVTVEQAGGFALVALAIICIGFIGLFFWVQAIMQIACGEQVGLDALHSAIIGSHWEKLLGYFEKKPQYEGIGGEAAKDEGIQMTKDTEDVVSAGSTTGV